MTFRTTTVLTSLALSLFYFQACGGEEGRKRALAPEAGSDGDAGMDAEQEDSSVVPDARPDVQDEPEPDAGPDAGPDVPDAEPPAPPELLFSVGPGATGIAGSAVAAEENPASAIYSSSSGSPDPIEGTNQKVIDATDLGILETDQIDAFTVLRTFPDNPRYLFSLEGPEGNSLDYTRTRRSYEANEPSGDVYFSDGLMAELPTEGGGDQGYNVLVADETSLGLAIPDIEGELDNLTGLLVRAADEELTELYFSVGAASVGPTGSALNDLPANERGCTILRSALDGTHSVAFTCAQLGITPDNDVDGLAVFGAADPTQILFSVKNTGTTTGLPGTPTEGTTYNGAAILTSPGDGTHAYQMNEADLGLDRGWMDDIDALAVVDQIGQSYEYDATCTITQDPISGPGGLTGLSGVRGIGSNIIILRGQNDMGGDALAAYNAQTCSYVGRIDLPSGAAGGEDWTMVPLPNWSAAMPFTYVEHWNTALVQNDAGAEVLQLERRDAQGDPVDTFLLESGPADALGASSLLYEPMGDRFFIVVGGFPSTVSVVNRPAPGADVATPLTYTFENTSHPCSGSLDVFGPDGLGNMVFAQRTFNNAPRFQMCWVKPSVELALPPIFWTPEVDLATTSNTLQGIVTPTAAYVLYQENGDGGPGPFKIERAALTPLP